jgi:hypothetical protein
MLVSYMSRLYVSTNRMLVSYMSRLYVSTNRMLVSYMSRLYVSTNRMLVSYMSRLYVSTNRMLVKDRMWKHERKKRTVEEQEMAEQDKSFANQVKDTAMQALTTTLH